MTLTLRLDDFEELRPPLYNVLLSVLGMGILFQYNLLDSMHTNILKFITQQPLSLSPYRLSTPRLMGTYKNSNIGVYKFIMFANIWIPVKGLT